MKLYIFVTSEGETRTPDDSYVENEQVLAYVEAENSQDVAIKAEAVLSAICERSGYLPQNIICYEVAAKFGLSDDMNLEPLPIT